MELIRSDVFPEPELPDGDELLSAGRAMASDWTVGGCEFLDYVKCDSEAAYKRRCMENGRIMLHAHMGFRDKQKSIEASRTIHQRIGSEGGYVDRYGVCLDWSMGFPRAVRNQQLRGTGLILNGPEEFAEIANAAPVAAHFGDFVLGFPAALENTQAALAAGSTVIGNLGQYFTFRLPGWDNDIETTCATLQAIGLISNQPVEVLVHSNLDDGFAAVFTDLSCALGAALIEQYIIEDLVGGRVTHCFGHHYSTPLLRLAFQQALAKTATQPGSMIYGNTVSYRGDAAANYASLAGYLLVDIAAQHNMPSGHALNPVPVTENRRIPDVDEIVDAQLCAGRLLEVAAEHEPLLNIDSSKAAVEIIVSGGHHFRQSLLDGFSKAGINIGDPFEMLLAIRRIGGKNLENWFGPGSLDQKSKQRTALMLSDTVREINKMVELNVADIDVELLKSIRSAGLRVTVATTDVHEHGKLLLEGVLRYAGVEPVDGGVSVDPGILARLAEKDNTDAIALSTYNGVALTYFTRLRDELAEVGLNIPVLIGGQLNEIPEDSDSSLPQDVTSRLEEEGAIVCRRISDALPTLTGLALGKS